MSLNWDQVTIHYKICKDVIAFRAFLEVPSGLIMPNKMAKVQMGIGWVPACWAGTHSGSTHFTCEIGTRVGTMIQFKKNKMD
jgi:hypothetical protein